MRMNRLLPATLSIVLASGAFAAEQEKNCRLKHGSMVALNAAACTLEGGTVLSGVVMPVPAATPLKLADDPGLAAVQRRLAGLLLKPVMDSNPRKRAPEWIERKVAFEGCSLSVEEEMEVEYSKTFSSRKHFKVVSRLDLGRIAPEALSVSGKVTTYGGGMVLYAVNIEERAMSEGNSLSVSISQQRDGSYSRYSASASSIFWDAPDADLRMADGYGYPRDKLESGAETDTIRVLYLMNTPEEAAELHKALLEVRSLCLQ